MPSGWSPPFAPKGQIPVSVKNTSLELTGNVSIKVVLGPVIFSDPPPLPPEQVKKKRRPQNVIKKEKDAFKFIVFLALVLIKLKPHTFAPENPGSETGCSY